MKVTFLIAIGVAVLAITVAEKSPIDWYDCTGKANGNYPHPVDCTRFVTCSNEIASERDCAICEYHPVRCPQGRLIFDQESNRCLYANEAKCNSLCDREGNRVGPLIFRGRKQTPLIQLFDNV